MRDLIKKLSRAERREEGCYLTAEMVRWLVNDHNLRREVSDYRNKQKKRTFRTGMTPKVITTAMVKEIRTLFARGYPCREIAAKLGIALETARKYHSDEAYEKAQERERMKYEIVKASPELMAKKAEASRRYQDRVKRKRAA